MRYTRLIFEDLGDAFDEMIDGIIDKYEDNPDVIKHIDKSYPDLVDKYDDFRIGLVLNTFTKTSFKSFISKQIRNERAICKKNETSFRYFFAYLEIAGVVHANIKKQYGKTDHVLQKDSLILCLYGYLIRLSDQIGTMLLNGYPDAAMRIWRSFYEYSITILLLMKENDDKLFQKFIDHSQQQQSKKRLSYQQHSEKLKFPPLTDDIELEIKLNKEKFKLKYGEGFYGKEWGWASDVVKGNCNFRSLEEHLLMSKYRPFYLMSSDYVHSGFNSFLDFRNEDEKIILDHIMIQSGDKDKIIDPMQFTLSVFNEVNLLFLKEYSIEHEYSTNFGLFNSLFAKLVDSFK